MPLPLRRKSLNMIGGRHRFLQSSPAFRRLDEPHMSTIYLIRHGETVWNRQGRLQGQLDSPLTLRGVAQAEAVARRLAELLGDEKPRLLASPLGRTKQTAAIIADSLGAGWHEVAFDDRLLEITLGDHDGYHGWEALDRDFPEHAARRQADPWHYRHPNGESSQMVQDRVRPLLEELTRTPGHHVVVAHGVVNKIVRGLYLGLGPEETFRLDRPQDSFHRLSGGRVDVVHAIEPAGEKVA